MNLYDRLKLLKKHYRINRKRTAQRLALAATSPYGLAAVVAVLALRIHAKGIGSPYELVETGALLLAMPLAWAGGVLLRDYLGK